MASSQVAAAASAASLHYQLFLDSFKGEDGQLPAKVEPEMEQHYLSAAFCIARVLQAGAVQHKEPRWASKKCWQTLLVAGCADLTAACSACCM
jgi:hypothetical protein